MPKTMILLLYGEDTFRLKRKLNEIINYYKKKHKSGLNLRFLDLREKNFEDFKNEIQSSPMFSEKKFLILENASLNSTFKEKFLKEIEKFKSQDIILLFLEKQNVLKDPFFQELKKHSKYQEFKPLNLLKLKYWVREEFKRYGKEIEKEALFRLIELIGNDLWQLDNEIKKLVNFQKGNKITVEDVKKLVPENTRVDVFKTIDAIAANNKKRALKLLNSLFEKGEKPSFLIAMLKFQFRNLLLIKDLIERGKTQREIILSLNLHSFLVRKLFPLAKRFNKEKLKRIYFQIFNLENKIKTGKIDPKLSLEIFVSQI
jgi:DNA polymerase-3 subunit delta